MDEHPNSYIQLPKLDETEQKSVLIAKFKAVTNQKYQKMLADKKETPTLVIPKSIPIFITTQLFMDLVLAIYDYLQQFISIIRKQKLLNKKLDGRINKQSELLRFDKHTLVQKQKQISIYYSSVLLKYSSKSSNKDQFFFQTLIYLISKILKSFYNREQYPIIEEETNRLFRTNRYNIIKKRHQNDQLLREYPVLKDINDQTKPLNVNCIISKAEEKSRAIKQMTKRNRLRTIIRDRNADTISLSNTPIQLPDSSQRSPILSTWLPSNRLRIKEFSRQRDMQISTIQRKKFKDEELDRIIKKSYFMDDQYY